MRLSATPPRAAAVSDSVFNDGTDRAVLPPWEESYATDWQTYSACPHGLDHCRDRHRGRRAGVARCPGAGDPPRRRPRRRPEHPRRIGHRRGRHVSQRTAARGVRKSDSQQVPVIHPTGRGTGSEANSGGQPVELRRTASERRRPGRLVPLDRPYRAGRPARPGEFCAKRGPGLNPRRRRADVQRQQPPLAQWRQQPGRKHRSIRRGEQSSRPLEQQRLWPHLAGERAIWRRRDRLFLD